MVKFYEERREEKLWVPYGSRVIEHQNWINENFPAQFRFQNLLIEADNVLQPSVLRAMLALDTAVKNVSTGTANWTSICYQIGHQCWSSSLLELWSFNENVINSLSQQDILDKINTNNLISPLTFRPYDVEAVLGEIRREPAGNISGAKATTMLYAVKDQTIERQGERIDEIRLDWEKKFLDVALEERSDGVIVTPYSAEQSWIDEAQGPIQKNLNLLAAGFVILFGYATMSLGQFNCIGQKMYVSLAGMVCVGLAVVGAMGVCSAAGAAYGPVHTILPFLILGIGVDDMFVIVTAWNNLSQEERRLDRRQQAALALKHAGVSITVTSMTDVVAFGVGASTVLPALQSFCIYAAVSVFLAFVYSCTLFFAVVCLDFQRWEGSRNAYCCCYKHAEDYRRTECSQKDHLQLFFQKIYAPGLLTTPGKIVTTLGVFAILGVSIWGFINLKQNWRPIWALAPDSYLRRYWERSEAYFSGDGEDVYIYIGNIDYYAEREKLHSLYRRFEADSYVTNGTVISWFEDYKIWVTSIKNSTLLGSDGHVTDSDTFHQWILQFLTTDATGRSHAGDVKLNVTTSPPTVIVLQAELYRNLGIAMAAVFVITLLLLADFLGSLWVLLCVVMTLVDVGGMLHHWGLTIDTVTTNIMVIAIGLAVDYATHICHTFLIVGGTRQVFNGGFSTFLAIVLLASSQHYVFITFFKVFFLVLLFGCLHGLVFLPVILSWLGPAPYSTTPVRDPAPDTEQPDKRYIRKVQTQGFVNQGLEMVGVG
uniref:SSD domain-containing protein n=1 Tax=Branchiostoma floridae TaxID=7739 RepID=C3YVT5_BRAFL|eukprot:XP_002599607.1 hypothetical protein BRAFLDRAFT_77706 [Branchiostoma floridae]